MQERKAAKVQPRIAVIVGEGTTQYFVLCENSVFCSAQNLSTALFVSFSAYYCFNLAYPPVAKNIFYFIQDFVLGHPDATNIFISCVRYQTLFVIHYYYVLFIQKCLHGLWLILAKWLLCTSFCLQLLFIL